MNPKIGTKFLRGHLHTSEQRLRWLQKSLTKLEQRQEEGFNKNRQHAINRLRGSWPWSPSKMAHAQPPTASESTPTEPRTHSDRKSTRLNSSHANISYAVFCLKKK